jgi:hypothetical protein
LSGMTRYRLSYAKTLGAAAALGLGVLVVAHLAAPAGFGIAKVLGSLALITACVAMGGIIALYREHAQAKGRIDLFCAANDSRSERVLATAHSGFGILLRRLWRRILGGRWLLVGDVVEISSLEEVGKTLDKSGCLDGLPFMPEMARSCGHRARVFRCVDKIYDYGRSKTLRRLKGVVLLGGLRCDGTAHGGCQASCYLLWKTAWLRPVPKAEFAHEWIGDHTPTAWRESTPSSGRYTCQYTQLAAASTPMRWWDVRQDLRPLFSGNVTLVAFCVAILTRLFNAVQRARGGVDYPSMALGPGGDFRLAGESLAPGDTVRVRAMADIVVTLDPRGRSRGLWFDRDMAKHCGRRYTVLKRVDRIIDDATGRMLEMKTPCLVLAGAEASGEFLRFCAQHEYPFWREVWLSREVEDTPGRLAADGPAVSPLPPAAETSEGSVQ